MSAKDFAKAASESEAWTLKQCLLKTKSEVFSLQSQLYKARALYEERKRSLKLQLNSIQDELDTLKRENDNLRASVETFQKQVTHCFSFR